MPNRHAHAEIVFLYTTAMPPPQRDGRGKDLAVQPTIFPSSPSRFSRAHVWHTSSARMYLRCWCTDLNIFRSVGWCWLRSVFVCAHCDCESCLDLHLSCRTHSNVQSGTTPARGGDCSVPATKWAHTTRNEDGNGAKLEDGSKQKAETKPTWYALKHEESSERQSSSLWSRITSVTTNHNVQTR